MNSISQISIIFFICFIFSIEAVHLKKKQTNCDTTRQILIQNKGTGLYLTDTTINDNVFGKTVGFQVSFLFYLN